ncbi:hypothetical protein B5X24_HaOG204539 [Helicoverpa armigera]|uniref:Uncharacterized protein n=1 Tax=Helicoverpa armigera TaxID=29058 RepID=A0A2W1BNE7_HELAM|nr:hypothetical protein B5X24_HaOG204539 [Helicoverpa armigera]
MSQLVGNYARRARRAPHRPRSPVDAREPAARTCRAALSRCSSRQLVHVRRVYPVFIQCVLLFIIALLIYINIFKLTKHGVCVIISVKKFIVAQKYCEVILKSVALVF